MRQRWKNAIRDAVMISVGIVFGLWVTGFSPIKLSCPSVKPSITPPSVLPVVVKKEPPSHSPTSRDVTSATQSSLKSGTSMRQHNNEYDKKIKRPKYVKDEFNLRQPLYVGVVTATEFLNTRATVVNNTWGKKASKIEFFAAEGQGKHPLPIVSLPGVDDTYPPQKKVYRMLGYMHDNYIDQYSWFLRADDDAYIRVPELLNFLSKFDPSEPLYIGAPGFGKGIDLERIKLYSHEHYCMGGPGVIFSRALLIQLAPHLDDCLENVVVSWNEDLEVGRCVSRKLDVQCTWSYEMAKLFYMDYTKGAMFKNARIYNDKIFTSVISAHPFKSSDMMYRIHQFFLEITIRNYNKQIKETKKELQKIQNITNRKKAFP